MKLHPEFLNVLDCLYSTNYLQHNAEVDTAFRRGGPKVGVFPSTTGYAAYAGALKSTVYDAWLVKRELCDQPP